MRRPRHEHTSALMIIVLSMVCGCSQETGVELTVTSDVALDQMAIGGRSDPDVVFDQVVIPETPRALDPNGESVVILVPDSLDGREVVLRVDGLREEAHTVVGQGSVTIVSGQLVPVSIYLVDPALECGDVICGLGQRCVDDECVCDPASCDGCCNSEARCQPGTEAEACGSAGRSCEACPSGEPCDEGACAGCNAETCSNGCCSGSTCYERSIDSCAPPGEPCEACDPSWADRCSTQGECLCGIAPMCDPGQRCLGNMCVCDDTSCPGGCCLDNACALRSFSACGIAGNVCVECDLLIADSCLAEGECACGADTVCQPGQSCLSGACFCDESSCPNGCCADGFCESSSFGSCGLRGSHCVECSSDTADSCTDGHCRCGDGADCGPGQRCEAGGICVCDADACPDGCCAETACEIPSVDACGANGSACVVCDTTLADRCSSDGQCRCGDGQPCTGGQRCDGGACVCTPESCDGCCDNSGVCQSGFDPLVCGSGGADCEVCPGSETCPDGACSGCSSTCSGCCSGPACNISDFDTCGADGSACVTCNPITADSCVDGACQCGGAAPCGMGQHCVASLCVCDDVSCPLGCCNGDICEPRTLDACGVDGGECIDCDDVLSNNCSTEGLCRCGSAPQCLTGQRCEVGTCECDNSSCPEGCCFDSICYPPSVLYCGVNGDTCAVCNTTLTDGCSESGECQCGGGAPCETGQHCDSGVCVCDSTSCPGCCDIFEDCLDGDALDACGSGGEDCQICPDGDLCIDGVCSGCDAVTCFDGCCSGNTCFSPPSLDHCGIGGEPCDACDSERTNICSPTGVCMCGEFDPCEPGLECVGGVCTCTPAACSGCCNAEGSCIELGEMEVTTCGAAGLACEDCTVEPTEEECLEGGCTNCRSTCLGCCSGQSCLDGDTDDICGYWGDPCQNCTRSGAICDDNSCTSTI